MNIYIILVAFILLIICVNMNTNTILREYFDGSRNVGEGTISYHKRMITKYLHRPTKHKLREKYNSILNKFKSFKRNYL